MSSVRPTNGETGGLRCVQRTKLSARQLSHHRPRFVAGFRERLQQGVVRLGTGPAGITNSPYQLRRAMPENSLAFATTPACLASLFESITSYSAEPVSYTHLTLPTKRIV